MYVRVLLTLRRYEYLYCCFVFLCGIQDAKSFPTPAKQMTVGEVDHSGPFVRQTSWLDHWGVKGTLMLSQLVNKFYQKLILNSLTPNWLFKCLLVVMAQSVPSWFSEGLHCYLVGSCQRYQFRFNSWLEFKQEIQDSIIMWLLSDCV